MLTPTAQRDREVIGSFSRQAQDLVRLRTKNLRVIDFGDVGDFGYTRGSMTFAFDEPVTFADVQEYLARLPAA